MGRSHHQAYAYLLTDPERNITPQAQKVAPKLRDCAVGANKSFLSDVGHEIDISHHASDQPLDASLVLDHEHFECPDITELDAGYQRGIRIRGDRVQTITAAPRPQCRLAPDVANKARIANHAIAARGRCAELATSMPVRRPAERRV